MFFTINKAKKQHGFYILLGIFISFLYLFFLTAIHYQCPFHELFGIWCAGCGGTRMLISFLHLDFYQSFRYNPLLFVLLIIGIIYFIFIVVHYIKKKELIVPSTKALVILLGIVILYMILRNIDYFHYLIPTEV